MRVESFPPIYRADAQVLILGSMPSVASLEQGQYYGHPRNAFWPLMAELFGLDAQAPYSKRVQALQEARVAVWDVLQSCVRPGSLDSSIERASEVPNRIDELLQEASGVRHVFLNGRKAEQSWRRYFAARIDLPTTTLPSTSPAMASLDFAGKLAQWRQVAARRSGPLG